MEQTIIKLQGRNSGRKIRNDDKTALDQGARLEFTNGMEGFHVGIFRVEKVDYTTISNYHLRDKGCRSRQRLLTMILALPEWITTIEWKASGRRSRNLSGAQACAPSGFYEEPIRQMEEPSEESDDGQSGTEEPEMETSEAEQPHTEKPDAGNSAQSNTHISKTYSPNTHKSNPYPSHVQVLRSRWI